MIFEQESEWNAEAGVQRGNKQAVNVRKLKSEGGRREIIQT